VTSRNLKELEQVRVQVPDLRFGQLIAIVGELAADATGFSLWDREDDDFVVALERFAADLARREASSGEPASEPHRGRITLSTGCTTSQPSRD
jgi:hypothetical protein